MAVKDVKGLHNILTVGRDCRQHSFSGSAAFFVCLMKEEHLRRDALSLKNGNTAQGAVIVSFAPPRVCLKISPCDGDEQAV